MSKRVPTSVMQMTIAITLMIGMVLSAFGNSISHLPSHLEVGGQVKIAALVAQIEDHGHAHDDIAVEEQNSQHMHGVNPADHSHEVPHLAGLPCQFNRVVVRSCVDGTPVLMTPGGSYRLERPPKPVSLV